MSICIKDQIQNMNLVIGCTVGCSYCYARNNVKRYHMIDDFADPEFFPGKLKRMEKKRPQNFLLTGMSDLSGWKPEWRDEVFAKIRENPQHQYLFLTKRPDLLDFDTNLENTWFGVTVTRKAELWRIDALRKNIRAKHYHVTFEPLFDDPGTVDLSGINWIVVGTMTGAQRRKIHTEPEWACCSCCKATCIIAKRLSTLLKNTTLLIFFLHISYFKIPVSAFYAANKGNKAFPKEQS